MHSRSLEIETSFSKDGTDSERSSFVSYANEEDEYYDHTYQNGGGGGGSDGSRSKNCFRGFFFNRNIHTKCGGGIYVVGALMLLLLFAFFVPYQDNIPSLSRLSIADGTRIHIRSVQYDRYIQVRPPPSSGDSSQHSQQKSESSKIDYMLSIGDSIPWKHGSNFDVHLAAAEPTELVDDTEGKRELCFRLRSMYNRWVVVNPDTGVLVASARNKEEGTLLTAFVENVNNGDGKTILFNINKSIHHNSDSNSKLGMDGVRFRVCDQTIATQTKKKNKNKKKKHEKEVSSSSSSSSNSKIQTQHHRNMYIRVHSGTSTLNATSTAESDKAILSDIATSFSIYKEEYVQGVNLGGWFIPEIWMTQSFSSGSGLGWMGSLCKMMQWNRTETEKRMETHLKEWITENDFKEIAEYGFNSVRIPIGYWNVLLLHQWDPPKKGNDEEGDDAESGQSQPQPQPQSQQYAPVDAHVSIAYLNWAFDMAERYGLSVLLDLHGAPGSQNGLDHSGCSDPMQWLYREVDGDEELTNMSSKKTKNDNNNNDNINNSYIRTNISKNESGANTDTLLAPYPNIQLTLRAVEAMVQLFGQRINLKGFELLNEPSKEYSDHDHGILLAFYEQSYSIIRSACLQCEVVFNELYEEDFSKWHTALLESDGYYNVAMDLHLYDWQEPYTSESVEQHIADAESWAELIQSQAISHPVIVGEWSMSTGEPNQAGQPFVDACQSSFKNSSFGWYLWNWKIERFSSSIDGGRTELLVNSSLLYGLWDVQYQLSTYYEEVMRFNEHQSGNHNSLRGSSDDDDDDADSSSSKRSNGNTSIVHVHTAVVPILT